MIFKDRSYEWYPQASEKDIFLANKVLEFGSLFADMLFETGSCTRDLIMCKMKSKDDSEWVDCPIRLPDELAGFDYNMFFWYSVKEFDDPDTTGMFDCTEQELSVSPSHLENDAVILHEMIHLHEYVINELPLFYHDAILVCLYNDLSNQIPVLHQRIMEHGHILNEQGLYELGGLHDILFLLKSFDLDLKMGYKLGTVFGYGMADADE